MGGVFRRGVRIGWELVRGSERGEEERRGGSACAVVCWMHELLKELRTILCHVAVWEE